MTPCSSRRSELRRNIQCFRWPVIPLHVRCFWCLIEIETIASFSKTCFYAITCIVTCSLSGLGVLFNIIYIVPAVTYNVQSYHAACLGWRHHGSGQMPFQRFINLIHSHPIQFTPTALFLPWISISGILSFFLSGMLGVVNSLTEFRGYIENRIQGLRESRQTR